MILGGLFAATFSKLAIAFPGKEGVSKAVRAAFGPVAGQLASNFIMTAACVGPVAILATAANEIASAAQLSGNTIPLLSGCLLIVCQFLLLRNITAVGTIAFVCSTMVALILVLGSSLTISANFSPPQLGGDLSLSSFGQALLLLFWTIIGWEIIGNYSSEVKTPYKTIPMATAISVAAISGIYLMTAWAIHCCKTEAPGILDVVTPLLGSFSLFALPTITVLLCGTTYLMIVGGISRLALGLAKEGRLPQFLNRQNANGSPSGATLCYGSIHILVIGLVQFGALNLEEIISFANVFFLANAILCILAAIRLLDSVLLKLSGIILIIGFLILLFFSPPWVLTLMVLITLLTAIQFKVDKQIQNQFR